MNNDEFRWFEYDHENEKYTYHGTENYVWGKKHGPNKRIGDMTREELIHVIAMTFFERDRMMEKMPR